MKHSQLTKERLKEADRRLKKPAGKLVQVDLTSRPHPKWMTRAYQNNRYIVMIDDHAKTDKGEAIRAMIQTVYDAPITNHWREMQGIKNELFGEDAVGVEFYPKESDLIDMHNIYWLWIFPDGILPKIL